MQPLSIARIYVLRQIRNAWKTFEKAAIRRLELDLLGLIEHY